jgi:DNA-binding transcriptional LysR family regulator
MELDEPAVILQMVDQGLGCAIIPADLVPLASAVNVIEVPLPGGPIFRDIGVLVRQSALRRAPVGALIDALVSTGNSWQR